MMIDQALLPVITPLAIAWAEKRSAHIAATGVPLNDQGLAIARHVGVAQPGRIRVLVVTELPLPEDSMLRQVALESGLLGPGMIGMALGHSIFLCAGYVNARLLSHECRHVQQYEQAGSIASYIPGYLGQIVQFGYRDAPYEIDARSHEIEA